jgi:hypothetical protein
MMNRMHCSELGGGVLVHVKNARCECDRCHLGALHARPRGKIERVRFVSAGDVRPSVGRSVAPPPKHASHAPKKKAPLDAPQIFSSAASL